MASSIIGIAGLYVAIGLFVGVAFVLRGVDRVDSTAVDSPLVFRAAILPGCVGLWPVVLWMWIKARKGASA